MCAWFFVIADTITWAKFRRGMSVDTAYLLLRYIFHFTYDKGERRKINVAS